MARPLIRLAASILLTSVAGCITVQLPEPASAPEDNPPVTQIPPAPRDSPPPPVAQPVPGATPEPVVPPTPTPLQKPDMRAQATDIALSMVGRPYRRGGSSPHGFDCSGLIQFSYAKLALDVPRDTGGLLKASRAIDMQDLRVGDFVFFHVQRRHYSHVGIYLGDGRFVHAPASGGLVRIESLSVPYWNRRFGGAWRLAL